MLMLCLRRRVEWSFWTSSNDACGATCNRQNKFKLDFAETAVNLQKVTLPTIAASPLTSLGYYILLPKRLLNVAWPSHMVTSQLKRLHRRHSDHACPVLCSKATHSSSHTSWHNIVWMALTVNSVKMNASTMADTVQWTPFQKACKASTRVVR